MLFSYRIAAFDTSTRVDLLLFLRARVLGTRRNVDTKHQVERQGHRHPKDNPPPLNLHFQAVFVADPGQLLFQFWQGKSYQGRHNWFSFHQFTNSENAQSNESVHFCILPSFDTFTTVCNSISQ